MHKRPSLNEAVNTLTQLSNISTDAKSALEQYHTMREQGLDFYACKMVVDIVAYHNHNMSVLGAANG